MSYVAVKWFGKSNCFATESVYRRALVHELKLRGIAVESEVNINVRYKGVRVGHFRADDLVERRIVVETKAGSDLADADRRQLINYLRGTELDAVGTQSVRRARNRAK